MKAWNFASRNIKEILRGPAGNNILCDFPCGYDRNVSAYRALYT